jgi:hypothetical protein
MTMKVQLKPEFHIVENCGLFSVVPVGSNGKSIGGWFAMYAPALGEGSRRPMAMLSVSSPAKGPTKCKACPAENWQVTAHKMFSARGWASPWQVVR